MNLYLLRHAIAAERDVTGGGTDAERPLTRRGERKMRRIAHGLRALGLKFDVVLSSPYLRARQTADILVAVFGGPPPVLVDALAPGGSGQALVDEIRRQQADGDNVVLVGHQPDLSELASVFCTGGLGLDLTLRKGGICRLAVSELQYGRCASLEWVLTPGQMVRLAECDDTSHS